MFGRLKDWRRVAIRYGPMPEGLHLSHLAHRHHPVFATIQPAQPSRLSAHLRPSWRNSVTVPGAMSTNQNAVGGAPRTRHTIDRTLAAWVIATT